VTAGAGVEALLREALAPVEPPATLAKRLELALASLAASAQDELEGWELSTMRDPRNWVRPVAAVVVTGTAGSALVALRVRGRHRSRSNSSDNLLELAGHTLRDIAQEARAILPDR
jgi:hypothetical protein